MILQDARHARQRPHGGPLNPRVLDEITRRAVELPLREHLILFGSAALGSPATLPYPPYPLRWFPT